MSAVTKAVKKVFKQPTKSGKTVIEEIKDGPESVAEKAAKREAASMGAERAAALRSRRRGYRSLLSPGREDQQGLTNKLGG